MKKILGLILTIIMSIGFVGCAKLVDDDGKNNVGTKAATEEKKSPDLNDVSINSVLEDTSIETLTDKLHKAAADYEKAKDKLDSGKLQQVKDKMDEAQKTLNGDKANKATEVMRLINEIGKLLDK